MAARELQFDFRLGSCFPGDDQRGLARSRNAGRDAGAQGHSTRLFPERQARPPDERAAVDRGGILGLPLRPCRQADRNRRAAARAAFQGQAVRAVPRQSHRAAYADAGRAAWRQ